MEEWGGRNNGRGNNAAIWMTTSAMNGKSVSVIILYNNLNKMFFIQRQPGFMRRKKIIIHFSKFTMLQCENV